VIGLNTTKLIKKLKTSKKILAIIPARSGSKGVINKNIKKFNKKPLIYWSINSALKSKFIDKCFVSTDSIKISSLAKKHGADSSFLRPKNISTDKSLVSAAIIHTLHKLKNNYDIIILLQPTSPLRTTLDIDRAIELFIEKKLTTLVAITDLDYPHEWLLNKKKSNYINFIKKNISHNRQQTKKYYKSNGAIFISTVKYFLKHKNFFGEKTYGYFMKKNNSIDIDSELDFKIAELIKKNNE